MRGRVWFRPFAGTLLFVYAAACYHYVPTGERGPEAFIAQKPAQVRVTLTDSSTVVLLDPWITADSVGGRAWLRSGQEPWAAARDSVIKVERQETKVVATVFGVGVPLVLLGVVVGVALALRGAIPD